MNPHLIAQSRAAKLCRTRKRRARDFARLCRVIRTLDQRLVAELAQCTPCAREEFRAQIVSQDSLMLDNLVQEATSPNHNGGAITR